MSPPWSPVTSWTCGSATWFPLISGCCRRPGSTLFRTGWFVESLATQTLVIFAIGTRRIPFCRSQPSLALLLAALAVVTAGAILPFTPVARTLGFRSLPGLFFAVLALMVLCYLVLIEAGKHWFYRLADTRRDRRRAKRPGPRRAERPADPSQAAPVRPG
jgi:Mg2+-importing ATPase